ncbi:hypothetical protein [Phreatobacter cathodiphilus]|uniref:hypothetical protein n=1 Tax=Phreatobacter cathodiphilus TaxID=1868589 RepID=UPI0011B225AD|nr:hypothetical protein [Phreatobacter cathodiphilus]
MKAVRLGDLLASGNFGTATNLPWTHSTLSKNIFDIVGGGKILATPCNVFHGEKLCYLFVGRPAYKVRFDGEASFWQLPLVFVIRFSELPPIKRIFPFDSGAFASGRLPAYVTVFDLERFDCGIDPAQVGRLISFYFGEPKRYFQRKPNSLDDISTTHSLGPRHQEVLAVSRLMQDNGSAKTDDRAATIEIQIDQDIPLSSEDILGVVMPDEYARDNELIKAIRKITKTIRTYPIHPLNVENYYHSIYEHVAAIYKKNGIVI